MSIFIKQKLSTLNGVKRTSLVEERALKSAQKLRIPKADRDRVIDTIVQKQHILTQAVNLFVEHKSSKLLRKK